MTTKGSRDSDDSSVPIELRYELEQLLINLAINEEANPVRVDEEGRFEICEPIGRGAMGTVYRAYDNELDRHVALKVVSGFHTSRDRLQRRLLQEARAMARLSHPNVLQVHDVRRSVSGERVVALEYIDGPSLRTWQKDRSLNEILSCYFAAAKGLAAAHERDIVHRDFKPDNVVVKGDNPPERVVVVDFGLAGLSMSAPHDSGGLIATVESTGLGTPGYMAPEQVSAHVTQKCDQYAFCVSLWEALALQRPFASRRSEDEEIPPRPSSIPRWLYRILARGLARHPEDRYPDMQALILDVELNLRLRRGLRWGAAAATMLAMVSALVLTLRPEPCEDAGREIAALWNPELRQGLARAFDEQEHSWSMDAGAHTIETLDRVSEAWSVQARALCMDERAETTALPKIERRHACLDDWFERIHEVTTHLRAGDSEYAENLVDVLQPLVIAEEICRVPPPVVDADIREALVRIDSSVARRDLEQALVEAERAVEVAVKADECVVGSGRSNEAAIANYRLGYVLAELERWDAAIAALRHGSVNAKSCDDPLTAFDALAHEALVIALRRPGDALLAERILEDAESQLIQAQDPEHGSLRRAEFWRVRGLLHSLLPPGDHRRALDELEAARRVLTEIGPSAPTGLHVQVLNNMGTTLYRARQYQLSQARFSEAVELLQVAVGDEHPATLRARALVEVNDGFSALESGDLQRAHRALYFAITYGEPAIAARGWSMWLQSRQIAGLARENLIEVEAALAWLEFHSELPYHVRLELLTTIGELLCEASFDTGDEIVDDLQFRRGLALLEVARDGWHVIGAEENSRSVRYSRAALLFDSGDPEAARTELSPALGVFGDEELSRAIEELRDSIESSLR